MSPHLDLFPGLQILCLKLGLIICITHLYQKLATAQIPVNRVCSPLTQIPKMVTYTQLVLRNYLWNNCCNDLDTCAQSLPLESSPFIGTPNKRLEGTSFLPTLGVKRTGSGARLPVCERAGI